MLGMNERDFDFLFGRWKGRNRRLKERLAGSNEWLEFDCTIECFPIWGGAAHYDVYEALDTPIGAIHGLTLRLYDPKSQQWAIYWVSSRNGLLCPPVRGGWNGDRGEFYGDDDDEGRPIHCRFVWERLGPNRFRWSQDFALITEGSGANPAWERNWVMEGTRIRD